MNNKSKTLAIIPARAGSKGLPGKNTLLFHGKPLVQWTIEAAIESEAFAQVVLTTDDNLALEIADSLGAVGHRRTPNLSGDHTKASEVIEDVVNSFPGHDSLVYLQPTSPLRKAKHILQALEKFDCGNKVPVVSVTEVTQPPEWMLVENDENFLVPYLDAGEVRRQDTKTKFIPNGAIYIADIDSLIREDYVFSTKKIIPYVMNAVDSIDIDDQTDFDFANWIATKS